MVARRFAVGILLLLAMGLGCADRAPPEILVLELPLQNGSRVRDVLVSGQRQAILVYSPGMCYSCSTMLTQWEQLEREGHLRITLLMSPTPTDADLAALSRQRIRVHGVVAWPEKRVPSEFLFEGDSLVAAAVGPEEVAAKALARRAAVRQPSPQALAPAQNNP